MRYVRTYCTTYASWASACAFFTVFSRDHHDTVKREKKKKGRKEEEYHEDARGAHGQWQTDVQRTGNTAAIKRAHTHTPGPRNMAPVVFLFYSFFFHPISCHFPPRHIIYYYNSRHIPRVHGVRSMYIHIKYILYIYIHTHTYIHILYSSIHAYIIQAYICAGISSVMYAWTHAEAHEWFLWSTLKPRTTKKNVGIHRHTYMCV